MKTRWPTGILLMILGAPMPAQFAAADTGTNASCEEYLKTPLPTEASLAVAPKAWPECNSYRLEAGIGVKVDYNAARKCAWSERLATQAELEPRFPTASIFGGAAMLTVLYANGEGVPRDISLALRFACEAGGAPAEVGGRLESLKALGVEPNAELKKFGFCDDITSGFMEGFCAAYSSEAAGQNRAHLLNIIVSRFTPIQRAAFESALKFEEAYALAHARGEIDLSGTARAMYSIEAEDTLRDDFLAALQSSEAGKFPDGSTAQYNEIDARLNSVYQKAISNAEAHKDDYGAVQPEGVRNAERAWLKYRDAWVVFAKSRYPSVPPQAWLVLLTSDRISILDGSFCDMGSVNESCARKGDTWKPSPLL